VLHRLKTQGNLANNIDRISLKRTVESLRLLAELDQGLEIMYALA